MVKILLDKIDILKTAEMFLSHSLSVRLSVIFSFLTAAKILLIPVPLNSLELGSSTLKVETNLTHKI